MKTSALPWATLLLILALAGGGCAHVRGWMDKPRPPYRRLSPAVAYEMIRDSPGMLVIDLRPPQQFNGPTGHIQRATSIPLARLPFRHFDIVPYREETVLLYCDTDECSQKAASELAGFGFESIVLMDGGIDGWIKGKFRTVLPASMAGAEEDKSHVMPERPGERRNDPQREVPVNPPVPPDVDPAVPPPPPPPG
jgi:rhodanese-related sulfurtransferase